MEQGNGIVYVMIGIVSALIMYTIAVPGGWDWIEDVLYFQF